MEKYSTISQLGHEGTDAKTYLVMDKKTSNYYAMKVFNRNKSSIRIILESKFQLICAENHLSPKIIECNGKGKFIVMEKLDYTLYDIFLKQNGKLTKSQQLAVKKIIISMDNCGIFHADPNPLNFMYSNKDKRWYIIDFGFSKRMTNSFAEKHGNTPNQKYMILGLYLKLKEINPEVNLKYLIII